MTVSLDLLLEAFEEKGFEAVIAEWDKTQPRNLVLIFMPKGHASEVLKQKVGYPGNVLLFEKGLVFGEKEEMVS